MGAIPDPVEVLAESLAGIQDRQPREQAFLEQIARLGVGRFAYVNTTQPSQPVHLETNYAPEWVGRYLSHNYAAIDPVSREAQRTRLLFQWRAALAMPAHDSPQARQLFAEAAEFGLHDGLCVPIHAAAGISTMSLAVENRDLFKPKAARLRQTLHLLALHYHLACERALAGAEPAPPPPAKPLPRLTPREREVLLWTAKGKTGWEIAQILRLAERTVVYHVENAKTKLGASSRSQAVVMALGMGLIDP